MSSMILVSKRKVNYLKLMTENKTKKNQLIQFTFPVIRYHLSLRQTDEKNKPKGRCGTGCESRSLYKVKKVLDKEKSM